MERLNNNTVILNNYKIIIELQKSHKTGSLYIKKGDVLRILYFNKGDFAYAHSNQNGEKLLDVIYDSAILSEEFINDVISNTKPGESLGKLFVQKGYLTPMQLSDILEKQQKKIFFSALFMKEGEIRFFDEELPENITPLNLDIIELIREGLYKTDDRLLILSLVGNFNNKLRIETSESEYIKDEEKNILDIIGDGIISEIINRSPYEEFKTLKIISFLKLIEVLTEFKDDVKAEEMSEKNSEINDEPFFDISLSSEEENSLENNIVKTEKQKKNFDLSLTEEKEKESDEDNFIFEDTTEKDLSIINKDKTLDQEITNEHIEKEVSEIIKTEKRKLGKIIFVFFLLIVIAIISVYYFLYYNKKENKKTLTPIIEEVKQKKIIPIEESKTNKNIENNNISETSPKNQIKKTIKTPVKKDEKKVKKVKRKIVPEKKKTVENKRIKYTTIFFVNYLDDIKAKRFKTAALKYKRDIIKYKKYYSILIEVDCKTESLETAYQHASFNPKMFIIPRTINNKFCYAILWGLYKDKKGAEAEKKNIPLFFNKQSPPPVIIPIDKYF